jgi:Na+/proline symporter
MLQGWVIVLASFLYLGVLFGIAWYADHRSDHGRSLIASPLVYALSLGVYCTTWTFYGSVGRAAANGIGFLPIYLGPTLLFALGGFILYRMIRIAKANRITSIADFVASRYGKSQLLGGLVTVIAVVGVIPYIALQLKAVSNSFTILGNYPEIVMPAAVGAVPLFQDSALYVAMILAAFTILFGTRHLDATERHEGMVAAIAVESVVKLVAFLAVGAFVVWGMHDGVGDIFARAAAVPEVATRLNRADAPAAYGSWGTLVFLSLFAALLLPRQFQIAVVENVDATHLNRAVWLFPLYLFLINLFVLPVALAGLMHFPVGTVDADTFVLTLPMAHQQEALALFVFIGGLSAATGMVIVETIALSTMICNDLVMPLLLRVRWLGLADKADLSGLLLEIRRWAIAIILGLGYLYFRVAGEAYALVSIGLISFAAVAQFAPVVLGGIFWKGGTRDGAVAGLPPDSCSGPTRCCCHPSPSRAGCRKASLPTDCSALSCCGRSSSSAFPGSTRSRIAWSGACWRTLVLTSAFRCCACPTRARRARPRCLSAAPTSPGIRCGAAAPVSAICCRWPAASSAASAPRGPFCATPRRAGCERSTSCQPMHAW